MGIAKAEGRSQRCGRTRAVRQSLESPACQTPPCLSRCPTPCWTVNSQNTLNVLIPVLLESTQSTSTPAKVLLNCLTNTHSLLVLLFYWFSVQNPVTLEYPCHCQQVLKILIGIDSHQVPDCISKDQTVVVDTASAGQCTEQCRVSRG